jgi:hypothetical protein
MSTVLQLSAKALKVTVIVDPTLLASCNVPYGVPHVPFAISVNGRLLRGQLNSKTLRRVTTAIHEVGAGNVAVIVQGKLGSQCRRFGRSIKAIKPNTMPTANRSTRRSSNSLVAAHPTSFSVSFWMPCDNSIPRRSVEARQARPAARLLMTAFAFGYALTVHMAQGSEFDRVVLIDEWFGDDRIPWLYTGITRAAKRITIARRS